MWRIVDDGPGRGIVHMETDRIALTAAMAGSLTSPTLRFFQWGRPTISFGYMLNESDVRTWAMGHETWDFVQRPTGGGAVKHNFSDLSFSLVWLREQKHFSDNPRACYAEIHNMCRDVLGQEFNLYTAPASCAPASSRFSACFEEPVCNDVMLGNKKVIGGALRVTKRAMLYQGAIQLGANINLNNLKKNLSEALLSPVA